MLDFFHDDMDEETYVTYPTKGKKAQDRSVVSSVGSSMEMSAKQREMGSDVVQLLLVQLTKKYPRKIENFPNYTHHITERTHNGFFQFFSCFSRTV